jgi:hypothetical protein
MPTVLINPMDETARSHGNPAPRLDSLAGKTIALLDISKPGGSFFLDRIERLLKERFEVAKVLRISKPTFAKPAPPEIIDSLLKLGSQAVIEGLAD